MRNNKHRTDFEQYFYEKSEEHHYAYNAKAWEELEARLDKKKKKRGIIWWWLGGAGLPLIILGIFLFSTMHTGRNVRYSETTTVSQDSSTTQPDSKNVFSQEQGPNTSADDKTLPNAEPLSSENKVNTADLSSKEQAGNRSSEVEAMDNSGNFQKDLKTTHNVGRRQDGIRINPNVKTPSQTSDIPNPIVQHVVPNQITVKDEDQQEDKDNLSADRKNLDVAFITALPQILNRQIQALVVPDREPPLAPELTTPPEEEKVLASGWILSAPISIDWSSTPSGSAANEDYKYGLSVARYWADRYAVHLGLRYVNDFYRAEGKDYHVDKLNYWTKGIVAKWVAARCKMLEIPLGFSFRPAGVKERGLVIQADLVSILILNEEYKYWYEEADPELKQGWKGTDLETNLLSNLHLGIGYQFKIADKWSVQLSPYVNIPISKLGHGNVKLGSIGVTSTINFNLR